MRKELQDLLVLQREYGMGVVEAYRVQPSWYVDMLLATASSNAPDDDEDAPQASSPDPGDPWASPPDL